MNDTSVLSVLPFDTGTNGRRIRNSSLRLARAAG